MRRAATVVTALVVAGAVAAPARAQSTDPKPWGRVSFFTNTSRTLVDGLPARNFTELTTAVTYTYPDLDDDGYEYGLDMRHSTYRMTSRPDRVSIYEGYVGGRFGDGLVKAKFGHVWLN